jgi:hypothetical protein
MKSGDLLTAYRQGKTEIRKYLQEIRTIILKKKGSSQILLIQTLSPNIRAWQPSALVRHVISQIKKKLNFFILKMLWRWASRRHSNKNKKWVKKKYFKKLNGKNWVFCFCLFSPSLPWRTRQIFLPGLPLCPRSTAKGGLLKLLGRLRGRNKVNRDEYALRAYTQSEIIKRVYAVAPRSLFRAIVPRREGNLGQHPFRVVVLFQRNASFSRAALRGVTQISDWVEGLKTENKIKLSLPRSHVISQTAEASYLAPRLLKQPLAEDPQISDWHRGYGYGYGYGYRDLALEPSARVGPPRSGRHIRPNILNSASQDNNKFCFFCLPNSGNIFSAV